MMTKCKMLDAFGNWIIINIDFRDFRFISLYSPELIPNIKIYFGKKAKEYFIFKDIEEEA